MATSPRPLLRIAVAVVACVAALTACSSDGSEQPEPSTTNVFSQFPGVDTSPFGQESLPPCVQPSPLDPPAWVPSDLPLPPGSYLSQDLGQTNGYQRGLFVVPGTLTDLARFVLTEWPKQGWNIGHGDSEEDEIETSLSKPPAAAAIKAQGVECSPGYSLLLLVYAPERTAAGPIPGTQGGSPLPTPTD